MLVASTAATITTAAISAGAGLIGVFAGSALSTRRERELRREGAVRALNIAALRCLARAHKIEAAERGTHEKAAEDRRNEIYHLGSDLDNYVVAIAGVEERSLRTRHWEICTQAQSILIGQQTENLQAVISALEEIRAELMHTASAN